MTPVLAAKIEHWPIGRLVPYARNARTHSPAQVEQIARSIQTFGFTNPILVDGAQGILAGHGRLQAAQKMKLAIVPVIVLDHLSEAERRAYILADNKLAENAGWDDGMLAAELAAVRDMDFGLDVIGFDEKELAKLLGVPDDAAADECPDVPERAVTAAGDLWVLGRHRLLCGDATRREDVERVMAGARANLVMTSPPYAQQREYDKSSGFKPIPPDEYTEWFREVAANIQSVLADDGSYFLNIKEHCNDGQRHLYVKDLTIAHVREWGWLFVDELCWKRAGVPGGWDNRFKNGWEPVFHFARAKSIKFRPEAVSHETERTFDYSPKDGKSRTGSGLLGVEHCSRQHAGMARPSNVIDVATCGAVLSGQHSAEYPVALPEFFIRAYSDAGDAVFDPFMGSGSTLIAAEKNQRIGYGTELSPAYCDVIVKRWQTYAGGRAVRERDGRTFDECAADELDIPLNCTAGQVMLGARDLIAEEAFAEE